MEIWMTILADYLLSLGFLTAKRGTIELARVGATMGEEVCLLAPFGLDPFDPVVYLVSREIIQFFALDRLEGLFDMVSMNWWTTWRNSSRLREFWTPIMDGSETKSFISTFIRGAKLIRNNYSTWRAQKTKTEDYQKLLARENGEMTAPCEGGETRTYSEWIAVAREISEHMWERFLQSGEDTEGDLDDDAWTLVG
jgi:hypothetical protein